MEYFIEILVIEHYFLSLYVSTLYKNQKKKSIIYLKLISVVFYLSKLCCSCSLQMFHNYFLWICLPWLRKIENIPFELKIIKIQSSSKTYNTFMHNNHLISERSRLIKTLQVMTFDNLTCHHNSPFSIILFSESFYILLPISYCFSFFFYYDTECKGI